MKDFRWPIIVTSAVLTLALFFAVNYLRQRYIKEEPFIQSLEQLESIDKAVLSRNNGELNLTVTPSGSYFGTLQELVLQIGQLAAKHYTEPPQITMLDRRNDKLKLFARSVTPALYEGAALSNYRFVADSIYEQAESYQLDEVLFAVDYERIYLQARDGEHTLYLLISLDRTEKGA